VQDNECTVLATGHKAGVLFHIAFVAVAVLAPSVLSASAYNVLRVMLSCQDKLGASIYPSLQAVACSVVAVA
jgi:hypothetical protein